MNRQRWGVGDKGIEKNNRNRGAHDAEEHQRSSPRSTETDGAFVQKRRNSSFNERVLVEDDGADQLPGDVEER